MWKWKIKTWKLRKKTPPSCLPIPAVNSEFVVFRWRFAYNSVELSDSEIYRRRFVNHPNSIWLLCSCPCKRCPFMCEGWDLHEACWEEALQTTAHLQFYTFIPEWMGFICWRRFFISIRIHSLKILKLEAKHFCSETQKGPVFPKDNLVAGLLFGSLVARWLIEVWNMPS